MASDQEKKITYSEKEWQARLTPEQFHILREKGTEAPFSGRLYHNQTAGNYLCAACGQALFESSSKYDSGTGWPSFQKAHHQNAVTETRDATHGMIRTEITCSRCGSHLGHVFEDGPEPSGKRYCINSLALDFKAEK